MSDEDKIPGTALADRAKADRAKTDRAKADRAKAGRAAGTDGGREPAGRYIGVYRIERQLGKGGMGKVYLAHDDRLGRPVAIKQIRSDKAPASKQRARLRREARAVAGLNHPSIARVHDVVYDEDGDSIVMEYVEGRNVAQLLAAEELDGRLAIRVAIQVAQGLSAAHGLGMVHRDLKAENVIVETARHGAERRAKILDFGLVKKVSSQTTAESLTERGLLLGTIGSMSPEQAAGRKVDARSDLFSFGVLLYEMFTGYSPFRRQRWLDSLEAVKTERQVSARALRPELPAELSSLIDRLLEKNPAHRPQTAREVVEELIGIAAGGISELPVPRVPRVGDPGRGHEPASSAGSVSATSAGAGGPARPVWLTRVRPSFISMAFLALATVALIAGKACLVVAPPLVLVFEPELRTLEKAEDYGATVLALRTAARDTLARLDQLTVADYSAELGGSEDPAELARRAGADEALVSELVCRGDTCEAELRRIRAADGTVVAKERFDLPAGETETTVEKVASRLRRLFEEEL